MPCMVGQIGWIWWKTLAHKWKCKMLFPCNPKFTECGCGFGRMVFLDFRVRSLQILDGSFIWQNVGMLWECCGVWPIELLSTWVRSSGTPKKTCHCACCIRRRQKRPHENHSIPQNPLFSWPGLHDEVLGYRNFVKLPLFTTALKKKKTTLLYTQVTIVLVQRFV